MNMSIAIAIVLAAMTIVSFAVSRDSDTIFGVGIIVGVLALIFASMGISDMNLDRAIEECERAGGTPVVRVGQVYSTLEGCDP